MRWFDFIDQFYTISEDKSLGIKTLKKDEYIFIDHFPNKPMLPAAMMVDTSVNLLLYWSWYISNYKKTAIAYSFDKFVFYNSIYPGQTFSIEILCDNKICTTKAWNTNTKERLYKGQIEYHMYDFEDFHDKSNAECLINKKYGKCA